MIIRITAAQMCRGEYLEPHDVIIVEGIHAFYDARLRAMMDLKLYMHVESDICLLRRIQRDINERGARLTTSLHNILQPSNRCLISISAIMSNTLT